MKRDWREARSSPSCSLRGIGQVGIGSGGKGSEQLGSDRMGWDAMGRGGEGWGRMGWEMGSDRVGPAGKGCEMGCEGMGWAVGRGWDGEMGCGQGAGWAWEELHRALSVQHGFNEA